jgi:hypothetical protein
MSLGSDPAKVSVWRERFARRETSELTTSQFCTAEGISQPSFYAWRRKLGLSSPRAQKSTPKKKSFQQVVVTSAPQVLTARLPGGIELEVSTAHENSLRAVVSALVQAGRQAESEPTRC